MAYLVVLVLNDPDQCGHILDGWEATGVKGITILESSGLGRVRQAGFRDDLPLMPSLHDLLRLEESHHRTLFSVVEHQEQVEALIRVTQAIIGDLRQPHTGLLFVLPLLQVVGLPESVAEEKDPKDFQVQVRWP